MSIVGVSKVMYHLVPQEIANSQRIPGSTTMMVMGVKHALLHGSPTQNVSITRPGRAPLHLGGWHLGLMQRSMCRTHGALQVRLERQEVTSYKTSVSQ